MEHQTVVYYTFCSEKKVQPKEYKLYQRRIADQILACGFEAQFGISFDAANVKKGVHGKPFWAGQEKIYFNVSNTAGMVVCALSDLETGADAEKIRSVKAAVIKRCCTDAELAYIRGSEENQESLVKERFFQLWTLKESFMKMTGQGMYFPIRDAEFFIQNQDLPQRILCSQHGYFVQKRLGEYWISICTQEKSEVIWRELPLEED